MTFRICRRRPLTARGLSHCKEEDTPEEPLEKAINAFLLLVDTTMASVARN